MAKIIVPIAHYSQGMLAMVNELLPNKERNLLIGIYTINEDSVIARTGKWIYGLKDMYIKNQNSNKFDAEELIPEEIKKFEWDAQKLDLGYDIHYTLDLTWETLMEESAYGNLLVIDITKIEHLGSIESILKKKNHCPVLFYNPECSVKVDSFLVPLLSMDHISVFRNLNYFSPSINYKKQIKVLSLLPTANDAVKQERYLVELLRSNFNTVSIHWLFSDDINLELEHFHLNSNNLFVVNWECETSLRIVETLIRNKRNFVFMLV